MYFTFAPSSFFISLCYMSSSKNEISSTKNIVIKRRVSNITIQDEQLQTYANQIDDLQNRLTLLEELDNISKEMYDYNIINYPNKEK